MQTLRSRLAFAGEAARPLPEMHQRQVERGEEMKITDNQVVDLVLRIPDVSMRDLVVALRDERWKSAHRLFVLKAIRSRVTHCPICDLALLQCDKSSCDMAKAMRDVE